MPTLAYVVSSHGFGHAARAAAAIDALVRLLPNLRVEILTGTPRWFFEQSLHTPFGYHRLTTDLGLVQASSLEEDLDATLDSLGTMLADPDALVDPIADVLRGIEPDLVVCDISPWGLEAARRLGLSTVLIENFTWHWIYRGYGEPRLVTFADRLEPFFAADVHIRMQPFCGPLGKALSVAPVARRPRQPRRVTRAALGVPEDASMALVTMGGVPWHFDAIESQLAARGQEHRSHFLVIAGGADRIERFDRCVLIPHRSDFYHPDLVAASDLVVGKLGYSTVAEVAENGAGLLYVPRPRFPESPPLEAWVQGELRSRRFAPSDLTAGDWLLRLDAALDELRAEPARPPRAGGAGQIADVLSRLLERTP